MNLHKLQIIFDIILVTGGFLNVWIALVTTNLFSFITWGLFTTICVLKFIFDMKDDGPNDGMFFYV